MSAVVGFTRADIAIPPPKGKKFVPVKSTVKLESEVKGYAFFTRANAPGQMGAEPKKFEVGTKEAVKVPEWGSRSMDLFAVPEDMVSKYKTVKEWNEAIFNKKDGILTHSFAAQESIDKDDARKEIQRAFVIKSVDAKGGIKVEEVKADGKKEEPKSKDKEEQAGVGEPRYLVAGCAAAVGVALAGLWAVRRKKVG
jgi:hypothetical protein